MPLPEIPAYSRGVLPFVRPLPIAAGGLLPREFSYPDRFISRHPSGAPYVRPIGPIDPGEQWVWRNEGWERLCRWPECDRSFKSGYDLVTHWQRVHQSPNDPPAWTKNHFGLYPQLHLPEDWYGGGTITDAAGRREAARRVPPAYLTAVQTQKCPSCALNPGHKGAHTFNFARRIDRRH